MAEQKREMKRALEREHKKAERQLQGEGKKPFFLKKCNTHKHMCITFIGVTAITFFSHIHMYLPAVQKQLELVDKYKELKRTGKFEKYLTKKRKRNAQRDRRQLPFKRKQ